jgi:hypothetical protein
MYAAGKATAREKAAHEAWKRSRGYGPAPTPQLTIAEQAEEYRRHVAHALKAEADQKAAWQHQNAENAA